MQPVRVAEPALAEAHPQTMRSPGSARHGVRDQILEAALVEFAVKGFQEASLAAIARRLGVTAPLVLYHFGSKANLWREAVSVFCANWSASVDAAATEGRSLGAGEALRLMVRRLVEFLAANRAACRWLRDEGGIATGQAEWLASKNLRPILETIAGVYRRAVEEEAVRPVPFDTALFLILGAASFHLESRALAARVFGAGDEACGTDERTEQVVRFCLDGLAMPPKRTERATLAPLPSRRATATNTRSKEVALR